MQKPMPKVLRYFRYYGNIALFGLTVFSIIWVFVSVNEFGSDQPLKYYTVLSNLLCGICSAVCIPFSFLLLNKENKTYEKIVYLFQYIGTVGVALTFLVVMFFLGPNFGFDMMLSSYNLFLHLIDPVLAILLFVFSTLSYRRNFLEPLYAIPPSLLYGFFYVTLYLNNLSTDFYQFFAGGNNVPLTILLMCFNFLAICYGLWILNALVSKFVTGMPLDFKVEKKQK